ncbi:hypothetical protein F4810DRAFT_711993 [Camillea tinctor]|nr:hypothetical protein F4810DRAFT_711993 [Camillea tinctor]
MMKDEGAAMEKHQKLQFDEAKKIIQSTQLGVGVYLTQKPGDYMGQTHCSVKVDAKKLAKTPKIWIPEWYGKSRKALWRSEDNIADYVASDRISNEKGWKAKESILMAMVEGSDKGGTSKWFVKIPEAIAGDDDMGWEIECKLDFESLATKDAVNYNTWIDNVGGSKTPVEGEDYDSGTDGKSKWKAFKDKFSGRDVEGRDVSDDDESF